MFSKACKIIRESVYGLIAYSPVGLDQRNIANGTAFMISPGICITSAHAVHVGSDRSKPIHNTLEVIRSPDLGNHMAKATFIAEHQHYDMALIEVEEVKNKSVLQLNSKLLNTGSNCGALGFPLADVRVLNTDMGVYFTERFQGAYISAFQNTLLPNDVNLGHYETDSLMYGGSSGCPGFDVDGTVFGMQVATAVDGEALKNSSRLAISIWIPSVEIIEFAESQGIKDLKIV